MTGRRTPVSRMLEGLEPEKVAYVGPVYAASSMPQGCPQVPVVWKRFKEEKTLPVGMVFVTKVPSGYGYFFFNVCHVEEEMVLVSNVSLGYRKGEPGSEGRTYVGRYRSNFSTYQGLIPSEVIRAVDGVFPRWEDIPEAVHLFAEERSMSSLERR